MAFLCKSCSTYLYHENPENNPPIMKQNLPIQGGTNSELTTSWDSAMKAKIIP